MSETGTRLPAVSRPEPSEEAIRERAYEISQRPDAGTAAENRLRARRELEEELTAAAARDEERQPFPPFTSALTHP